MAERLVVRVEKMAPEGEGLAKAEGSSRVVFVPYGVPGDRLEVEIGQAKSSFARGKIVRVIDSGPDRIAPPCPLHYAPGRPGPACGGCDWQQLKYEAQLVHKRAVVVDCLERIGKQRGALVTDTLPSPKPWGYRNKVQIPFGVDPKSRRPVAGFYEVGSHRIVDFEACPVQPELSVRAALFVKRMAAELRWPVYEEDRNQGWLRHVFVRTNEAGKGLLALVARTDEFPRHETFLERLKAELPEIIGVHLNVQPLKTSVVLGPKWRAVWGARQIEERIGPFAFLVSPGAFLQVNTGAAEKLYAQAEAALAHGGASFEAALDLYCGAGTLTLFAARAAGRVVGVEESKDAVRDAWKNAERNGIKNVSFRAGRVESVLPRLRAELPQRLAVVVDPPRMGLSQTALRFLTTPSVKRVVYVSCNPATFARDAGYLAHAGFTLGPVRPVDLFPQTAHVELVARLDRK